MAPVEAPIEGSDQGFPRVFGGEPKLTAIAVAS